MWAAPEPRIISIVSPTLVPVSAVIFSFPSTGICYFLVTFKIVRQAQFKRQSVEISASICRNNLSLSTADQVPGASTPHCHISCAVSD